MVDPLDPPDDGEETTCEACKGAGYDVDNECRCGCAETMRDIISARAALTLIVNGMSISARKDGPTWSAIRTISCSLSEIEERHHPSGCSDCDDCVCMACRGYGVLHGGKPLSE